MVSALLPHVEDCITCGACLPVCPTYRESWDETKSPRGRVQLIRGVKEGRLLASPNFRAHMYLCLDCRACEPVCPSQVPIGSLVVEARALVEAERRPPVLERLARRLVLRGLLAGDHRWLELAMWPLILYQRSGLQWLVRRLGVLRLLPPQLRNAEGMLRWLPVRPVHRRVKRIEPARGTLRHRVGFFLGCVMDVMFADASEATVRLMQANGCEVYTPREQRCCGAPHVSQGELETARELARHNVALFERLPVDVIVTDCAACGAETKGYGQLLADDPQYAERAAAFSAKVRDVAEFLARLPLKPPLGVMALRTTYHDPCHLCNVQKVRQEPRQLMQSLPAVEYVELPEADSCCGSAGDYVLTHPTMSAAILERKLDNIEKTGAEVVASGNPGCLLQLEYGVRRRGLKIRVRHVTELLWESYRKGADGGSE